MPRRPLPFDPPALPGRPGADRPAGVDGETRIATADGWVAAARLRAGQPVLTFDHGAVALCALRLEQEAAGTRIFVPAGALDNRASLWLWPAQPVMLDTDLADWLFGDPFVLLPIAALEGYRGISAAITPPRRRAVLRFDDDEVIYAQGAALLLCAAMGSCGPLAAGDPPRDAAARYRPLSPPEMRRFVTCLIAQEAGAALGPLMHPDARAAAIRALS